MRQVWDAQGCRTLLRTGVWKATCREACVAASGLFFFWGCGFPLGCHDKEEVGREYIRPGCSQPGVYFHGSPALLSSPWGCHCLSRILSRDRRPCRALVGVKLTHRDGINFHRLFLRSVSVKVLTIWVFFKPCKDQAGC